jgi:hypothetical protein
MNFKEELPDHIEQNHLPQQQQPHRLSVQQQQQQRTQQEQAPKQEVFHEHERIETRMPR